MVAFTILYEQYIVFSNSLSILKSLKNTVTNTTDIAKLIQPKISQSRSRGRDMISIISIHEHSNIENRSKTDQKAQKEVKSINTPKLNTKSRTN